ncbi:unnamed protein product, partial [Sphacelaria rigidula]
MEQDTKAAKKSRDRAQAAAGGGVGLLQSFFFNKKPTHPVPATPANPAATPRVGQRSDGSRDAGSSGGKLSPTATSRGSREGARKLIKQAVPNDFAGRSWDGYLHHVKFLVALLHVGTSLMPKNLIKILGHYLGYTPSFEKGLSLLASCCTKRGMRRPCAAAVLELLVFREFRQPGAGSDGRVGGGAGRDEALARATALDDAQVALESFYAAFPVVPLLSVPHAKALQASGEFEEAYELCLMAQEVVEQSALKGGGMGPAHEPHILWLQLAQSSFFLQRWSRALEFFNRIVEGVSRVCLGD